MLGKRKASRHVAPIKKRRKGEPAIEEITFNINEREEYLTGFHKRKLQRIKHAKEEAAKKEREERVANRKALRENRRADLEKHVEAVNAAVRDAENTFEVKGSGDEEKKSWDDLEELWNELEGPVKVDREDDYLDEDKHTVVTVEAVDISHEGLQKRQEGSDGEDIDPPATKHTVVDIGKASDASTEKTNLDKRSRSNASLKSQPKKKRKKFRYENKAERKVTRMKERSGGKAKAKERRSK
ncbi:MAG: hypothetical protein Q9224_004048 [Gallowayella concinna]